MSLSRPRVPNASHRIDVTSARSPMTMPAFGLLAVVLTGMMFAPGVQARQATGSDDFARRQYETGLNFLREGRVKEALQDFQAVADNHPSSTVADLALLQMATYYWEQTADATRTSATIDRILRVYPTGRAAPFAHLLSGRVALGAGTGATGGESGAALERPSETAPVAAAEVDAALASFERARRLFPVPDVSAASRYFTGEALRRSGRCPEALDAYQDVTVDYTRLVWAGRAELGIGRCLVALDRVREAMPHLQRVRRYGADLMSADAQTALEWNTILSRIHLRAPADAAFAFAGPAWDATARPVRDVVAIAATHAGQVAVLTEQAFSQYATQHHVNVPGGASAPAGTGTPGGAGTQSSGGVAGARAQAGAGVQGGAGAAFAVSKPRGLMLDRAGRPVVIAEGGLLRAGAALLPLRIGASGATPARPLDDLTAGCTLSTGEMLVADRRTRAIHRFAADGSALGRWMATNVTRLAANERDEIVALERDTRAITLLDRQGTVKQRLAPRGEGYQLDEPIDVAIDPLGHVYVLDRRQAAVFVFGQDARLLAALRSPEAGEGAFRQPTSLAVDAIGRVYVHDERSRRVVVYR